MENHEQMDALYDAALEYRKTKLWHYLADDQVFCVKLLDGSEYWVVILGQAGQSFKIVAYPGNEGLLSYLRFYQASCSLVTNAGPNLLDQFFQQRAISLELESKKEMNSSNLASLNSYLERKKQKAPRGKLPSFSQLVPFYMDVPLSEDDYEPMRKVIEACVWLNNNALTSVASITNPHETSSTVLLEERSSGWTVKSVDFPKTMQFKIEFNVEKQLLEQARKIRKTKDEWALVLHAFPQGKIFIENSPATKIPLMGMVLSKETDMLMPLVAEPDNYLKDIFSNLIVMFKEAGKPKKIYLGTEDIGLFLQEPLKLIGVEVSTTMPDQLEAFLNSQFEMLEEQFGRNFA